MKKTTLFFILILCILELHAQWNPIGDNTTTGNVLAKNLLINRGTISHTDIDASKTIGIYKVQYPGYSGSLLDISGIGGSTPRFQFRAFYHDKLYFRAARDSENNWDGKGFKEILMAQEDGKINFETQDLLAKTITANNLFINRGTIDYTAIDAPKANGVYKVQYPGYSASLLDINGMGGSTPRLQFRAVYNDRLYFRAARDSEANWDNKGFKEIVMVNENGRVGIGTLNPSALVDIRTGTNKGIWINSNNESAISFVPNNGNSIFHLNHGHDNRLHISHGGTVSGVKLMTFVNSGNVGIGTVNPDMKLTVNGNIHAKEVKIDLNIPAPDYVFNDDYALRSIEDVENFIKEHSHLPEIPSAKEFEQNGIMQAEMDMHLLKKIEELTLYTIQQEKQIKEQAKEINRLQTLENRLARLEKLLKHKE